MAVLMKLNYSFPKRMLVFKNNYYLNITVWLCIFVDMSLTLNDLPVWSLRLMLVHWDRNFRLVYFHMKLSESPMHTSMASIKVHCQNSLQQYIETCDRELLTL